MSETTGRDPGGRGSGRILRVLDEPSPRPVAGLDVEHAPKRRGRKPGSKNRPKSDRATFGALASTSVPGDRDDASGQAPSGARTMPTAASGDAATGAPVARSAAHATMHGEQADRARADHVGERDALEDRGSTALEAEPVTALSSRERRRFSWVRTKLKPGQEWKKRLPKVCW